MINQNPANKNHNFNLKNVSVELIHTNKKGEGSERADLTVDELEALRVGRPAVPASKNGLEVICGASCEIGAH